MVTYFTLFAGMGTALFGRREVSYFQDDREKRSDVFWNTEILSCISVFVVSIIYFFFSLMQTDYQIFYIILSLNLLTVAFDITWFFQGMEEFEKIVIRNVIFKVLNIVFIFTFVNSEEDIYIYAFGLCIFNILSALSMWLYLPKYVDKIKWKCIRPFRDLRTILSLFIPTVAISIYTVFDKTMIGWFSSTPKENGCYEQATKIIHFLSTFVTSLAPVMIPRIGNLFEKKEKERVNQYMYKSYNFVWFISLPMCFGLIAIASNVVPWFLGEDFIDSIPILQVFGVLLIALGVNNVTGEQYLIPTKQEKIYTKTVIIGAITNLMCNMILIPKFGAVGAAIGSVIAESVIAIVQLFFVRKQISCKIILTSSIRYMICSLVMFLVLRHLLNLFEAKILNTLILICIGGVLYFLLLFVLKDPFLKQIGGFIFHKIKAGK